MPNNFQPTTNQLLRAGRSRELLDKRKVPMLSDPFFLHVDDDKDVVVQAPQEVVKRASVLRIVVDKADGALDSLRSLDLISTLDLTSAVSPEEQEFLNASDPDPEVCQSLIWRLEAIWVLLWALGLIDELLWPSGMCDVQKLDDVFSEIVSDPFYIEEAKVRPAATLLDAQDLTMRIHWAINNAISKRLSIPKDLDWGNGNYAPVSMCPAAGVVIERHLALNWILNYCNPDNWDLVGTDT